MLTPSAQRSDASPVGFNIAAIMLVLALCGVALAYAIDAASRQNREVPHGFEEQTALTRTIGGRDLEIPLSWFRYAEQRVEGFAKQIDLRLSAPLGPKGEARGIEVTLLPKSLARPSSRLLDGVYLHQFLPEQLSGPPGLVGKPLSGKDGFEGETVWYDPLSADPFVAKCGAPVTSGAEARCLRTVYLGPGIAAVYAFGADVLANWRSFDEIIEPRLASIGAY
ncbi:MAG: hypothetical protein ACYC0C_18115 [Devosia sp.]